MTGETIVAIVEEDRAGVHVCVVEAPVSHYVIEPHRFELGLTRVQMVDDHLARLITDKRQYGADADTLLEARAQFAIDGSETISR
jgi:hypothetical protein